MKTKISFLKKKEKFIFYLFIPFSLPDHFWVGLRGARQFHCKSRAGPFLLFLCFPQSIRLVLLGSWIDRNPPSFLAAQQHTTERERETIVPSVEKRAPCFFFLGWWLRAPGATASLPSVGSRSSSFPLLCGLSSFNKATSSDQSLPERIVFFLCVCVCFCNPLLTIPAGLCVKCLVFVCEWFKFFPI